MAILNYMNPDYPIPIVDVKEYAIGGKLITCSIALNGFDTINLTDQEIKSQLAKILADGMIQNNLVEFTKRYDSDMAQNVITARCYLAPNDQVKILRELK